MTTEKNDIANLRSARIKEVSLMTTIQLSKTAETLLKRIVESRFGSGSGSSMFLIDSMIEHLIHEEARRLKVTDQDIEKEMIE